MKFFDTLKIARNGIGVHKTRSILTILGIVIGVTSVMTIVSIGQSAEKLIIGEIQQFGPTNIFILPGRQPKGPTDAAGTLANDSLTQKDLEDLKRSANVPSAVTIVPFAFGSVSTSFDSNLYESMLIGSSERIQKSFNITLARGNFFSDADVESRESVVIIGDKVKKELFGEQNPIGEKIKIKNQKFTVIGVIEPKGQGSFIDFNKAILAPYTSVQQNVLGIRYFQRLIIEARTIEDVPGVIRDVKTLLRNNHNIDDPEKDDFWIQTQDDLANRVKSVTGILTVLLSSVAAISLVVGGVGIMNIMLVSVTERTKEIGLRKALGARSNDILKQFLFEALTLTLVGGILGVIFGVLLTLLLSYIARQFAGLDFPFVFSVSGMLLGFSVSIVIGLVFGIFPARNAAHKSPVESLRSE